MSIALSSVCPSFNEVPPADFLFMGGVRLVGSGILEESRRTVGSA
jgi:hypothetical protein